VKQSTTMTQIIDIEANRQWDDIVRSFAEHDVYYLSGYVRAFQLHGDGRPTLLYYQADGLRAIYVFMKRETAMDGYYDCVTPYGYGGVLFEGNTDEEHLRAFRSDYLQAMNEAHIVDNFVRYHPVLANAVPMKSISTVIDLGQTIAMDLCSPEQIWENITSKNRNVIRKAEKNGVEIHHSHSWEELQQFIPIYNATMQKDHAEEYYYFGEAFYKSICQDLDGHFELFYATLDGKMIAASIMLFANRKMHYHLSGSLAEYRSLAPTNLLLYKAALWGHEQGYSTLHLGGGVGSGEDNLYKFKAAFNRNSNYRFSIGKEIFNEAVYGQLVAIRQESDETFNPESHYFPLYRS